MLGYFKVTVVTILFTNVVASELKYVDPCFKISSKPYFSYEEAVACNTNFPIDSSIKDALFASINNTLQFYAYLDIIKRSPTPQVPSTIDILSELNQLKFHKFKNEYEMHLKLTRLFLKLNDGHTIYQSSCINQFVYRQPFPLVSVVKPDGSMIIKVIDKFNYDSKLVEIWKQSGIDVYKYAGKQVLLIEGQLPFDYLNKYAGSEVGTSRDPYSRLQLLLARSLFDLGNWGVTYGSFASTKLTPTKPGLQFTFKVGYDEEKVYVPYIVSGPNSTYNSSETFYNNYCKPLTNRLVENNEVSTLKLKKLQVPYIVQLKPDQPLLQTDGKRQDAEGLVPLVLGKTIQSYKLNSTTAILFNPSFGPDLFEDYYNENTLSFQLFKDHNLTNLILDFSNNGGGYICLGYSLLEYLFPNYTDNYFATDMKLNPLLETLTERSIGLMSSFDAKTWRKPDGSYFNNTKDFLKERKFNRGGVKDSKYNQLFLDNCFDNPYQKLIEANGYKPPFQPKNIAIVTNGICYSACTLVVNSLQLNRKVKNTFTVGNSNRIYDKVPLASLAGGTVFNDYALIYNLNQTKLSDRLDAPKPSVYSSLVNFNLREAYPYNSDVPLEFNFVPGSKRITYNDKNLFDPFNVWQNVGKVFS